MRQRQHLLANIRGDRENAWQTAPTAADRAVSAPKLRNLKLDSIDRRILKELQGDGRISFTELAPKVGLTTSPCLERVRRLERAGVIKGYTATLDPWALDAGVLVFVELSLTYITPEIQARHRAAAGDPGVPPRLG